MMIPGFVTIIIIEVSYLWQKKIRSAQNVMDVSFFCSEDKEEEDKGEEEVKEEDSEAEEEEEEDEAKEGAETKVQQLMAVWGKKMIRKKSERRGRKCIKSQFY